MKNLILLVLSFFVAHVEAQTTSEIYSTADGAIKGYDPVAYFTAKKPVKGKKEFSYSWKGQTWFFASAENKKMFEANPETYAPQYGGYCAYGLSRGYKAKIEPEAWSVVNGKLYLNYNLDVREDWLEKQADYIQKADKNWTTVKTSKFKE
jgi:YHS domain-containing protein